MPWATPPCTWPSTMLGLIIRPQSSDTTNRRISTLPVAGSTSTVAPCVAFDHMLVGAMLRCTTSSVRSSSGGSVRRLLVRGPATCCTGTDLVGVPFTDTVPSATSRSSGDASSRWAAMATTLSRRRIDASVDTLQAAVEAQAAAGIMMVSAAQNAGPACSTVQNPPGIYEATYSIGALNTGTDTIAGFSSRGPVSLPMGAGGLNLTSLRQVQAHAPAPTPATLHMQISAGLPWRPRTSPVPSRCFGPHMGS